MKVTREIKRALEEKFSFLREIRRSEMKGRGSPGNFGGFSVEKCGIVEIDLYDGHDVSIKLVDDNLLARMLKLAPPGLRDWWLSDAGWAILGDDRIVNLWAGDSEHLVDSIGRQIAPLEGVRCVVVSTALYNPPHSRSMTIYKMEKFDLRAWAQNDHARMIAELEA